MSVRAVKEKAAKLVASGQFERAEVLLRQALTQSPRDVATWLRHAEVLKRLSRNPDAVASYRLAARILDEEGHHPRAVAALKLALSLVPDDVDLIADIIRSEMRARREGSDVRALFPLSSPSQLLTGASSESGLFQGANAMAESSPQLALPMSTPVRPVHVEAPASLRAENAAARADAWVPEPTAPDAQRAGSFAAPPAPLPPPEREVVAEASSPVPSDALPTAPGSPQPLVSDGAMSLTGSQLASDGAMSLAGPSQLASDGASSPAVPAPYASGSAMSFAGSSQLASGGTSSPAAVPAPHASGAAMSLAGPSQLASGGMSSPTSAPAPLAGFSQFASDGTSSPAAVPAPLASDGTSPLAADQARSFAGAAAPLETESPSPPDDLPPPPPSAPVRFEVESSAQWPQVRRLTDTRIAVQAAEGARWVVLESSSAIAVRFADELEIPDDAEWLE